MSLITEDNATGTGSASTFNFTFEYVNKSDVYVSVDGVVQTLNTHYTFAPNTSSVTFLPAHIPANGAAVRIFRDTSISTPSAEFFPGSAIRAQDLNANNDQVLFSAQERKERSLDATGGSLTGELDMQTNKIVNLGTPTANADASTKAYVDSTVGLAGGYASAAAASAAAALASETAASTSETNAATSETNAATSATNSATSATNSATSATASATSATAAATSETNAATSETNAATSATAASNSATSAATSAASALAAFDNFDDTYLGTKTSDPATDNDGDPLNAGDLYFNSTLGVMKVYTGSAWVIAYVPGDAANITSTATGDVAATNVQDAIAELDTDKLANNVSATDRILGRVTAGAGAVEEITCTQAGRDLLDDADAAAQRTTLAVAGTGTVNTFGRTQSVTPEVEATGAIDFTQSNFIELGTGDYSSATVTQTVIGTSGLFYCDAAAPSALPAVLKHPAGTYTAPTAFPAVAPWYQAETDEILVGSWTQDIR